MSDQKPTTPDWEHAIFRYLRTWNMLMITCIVVLLILALGMGALVLSELIKAVRP